MLDLIKIGNKITKRRKELKMTQNDLAEALYVTHQAVSKWENGKSVPTIEILYSLTKLFDISIDYLLDHSEIDEFDYETKFKNYSREIVLSDILKKDDLNQEIDKFFYLLNNKERRMIINQIINKQLCIEIKGLWPYLNKNERFYLIGSIVSGKCDYDLSNIYHMFTQSERIIVSRKGFTVHKRNHS